MLTSLWPEGKGKIHIFEEKDIPYEKILTPDFQALNIPSWAEEGTELGWMLQPYAVGSGRSHSLHTIEHLALVHGMKRDPTNRKEFSGEPYENWNLRLAIEDWIFAHTGFTVGELQELKAKEYLSAAQALEAKGENKLAQEQYKKGLQLRPNNLPLLKGYLDNLETEEKINAKEVMDIATRIITIRRSNDPAALLARAMLLSAEKNYSDAFKDLEKLVDLQKVPVKLGGKFYSFETILDNFARVAEAVGHHEKALAAMDELLVLDKEHPVKFFANLSRRGRIYWEIGDHEKAISDLTRVLESTFASSEEYNMRGVALLELGEKEKALSDFNKAIELNPSAVDAYFNRANALEHLGNYAAALTDLNLLSSPELFTLIKQEEGLEKETLQARARVFHGLKDYVSEVKSLEKLLEIDPTLPLKLQLAGAYYHLGNYEKSFELFSANDENLSLPQLREYADAAMKTHRLPMATVILREITEEHTELMPKKERANDYYLLAESLYASRDDPYEIVEVLEEAKELDPKSEKIKELESKIPRLFVR